jgi:hypothetical protein
MAEISPLRRRMVDDMMIRNLSPATQQSYLYAVSKFSRYFGRCPDRLSLDDVRAYQLHLIAKQRSWSHINQTVCALRFFYGVTLGRADAFERIVAAREPQKPPVVLGGDEIMRFLEAVSAGRTQPAAAKRPRHRCTVLRATLTATAMARSERPHPYFSSRISPTRRVDTLSAGIGPPLVLTRWRTAHLPSGRATTPHQGMADFRSEWPTSNGTQWPTRNRNAWPTCPGIRS